MRQGPSLTAAWVAFARAAGGHLPEELVLATDPHGARFAEAPARVLSALANKAPRLTHALLLNAWVLTDLVLWMQLRTRAIDDVLLQFLAGGGQQVVVLGAGYDARALRFAAQLGDAKIFEVDHPYTQQHKLSRLPPNPRVSYLSWEFEHMPMAGLADALVQVGLDRTRRTLTIWEGVTMYLSAEAIDQSLGAIAAFGSTGSWLVFNYVDRSALERPTRGARAIMQVVRRSGEPFRFGIPCAELCAFLEQRGYVLRSDTRESDLVQRFMPNMAHRQRGDKGRSIALAITA
jgi:methyltransferase (TIGR00027 family)